MGPYMYGALHVWCPTCMGEGYVTHVMALRTGVSLLALKCIYVNLTTCRTILTNIHANTIIHVHV